MVVEISLYPPLFQSMGIIQLVVGNLYTKFEVSILNGCGDIFEEKSRKKKEQIQGRTNRRRPIFNPNNTACHCEPVYKI